MDNARSASDDKAGVDAILNAYDAINKSGLKPTYNLKFFLKEKKRKVQPISMLF
jgi:acetylornithine deacetylase/succinyl-diaminopimelate desuccinylase-like protein